MSRPVPSPSIKGMIGIVGNLVLAVVVLDGRAVFGQFEPVITFLHWLCDVPFPYTFADEGFPRQIEATREVKRGDEAETGQPALQAVQFRACALDESPRSGLPYLLQIADTSAVESRNPKMPPQVEQIHRVQIPGHRDQRQALRCLGQDHRAAHIDAVHHHPYIGRPVACTGPPAFVVVTRCFHPRRW
jgi:hypothetical protein